MVRRQLKTGEKVSWNSSQGRVTGKIVRKQTQATKVHEHKVTATESDPQYIVESEKTGKRAAHKPNALQRVR
jgi:hypothetical protein